MRDLTAMPADKLPRAAKMRAARAIEDVHIAYYEKGGVRDLEEKLNERRGAAARHIYGLAVWASENAKNRAEAIALFLGMCAYAETLYKEQHNVVNLKDALPTWAVYKSNILRGIREYKLDPSEYRSEGAFRVAMQKLEQKALLPSTVHSQKTRLDQVLADTVRYDTLRLLVQQIIFEVASLKPSKKDDAAAVLRKTMDELQPLVDPRKVTEPA